MIPHHLHHIWLGPKPVPMSLVRTWQDMHPGWEHSLWTEHELEGLLLNRQAFDQYLAAGLWHGAANVARYEVVNMFGGVYVDMDTRPLRPLDRGPFMKPQVEFFAGYVQPRPARPGLIGNAYIGAISGHPVLVNAITHVSKLDRLVPPFRTSGVYGFTEAVEQHFGRQPLDEAVRIMPPHTFYPHSKEGDEAPAGRGATYAEHLWGSTKVSSWEYPNE